MGAVCCEICPMQFEMSTAHVVLQLVQVQVCIEVIVVSSTSQCCLCYLCCPMMLAAELYWYYHSLLLPASWQKPAYRSDARSLHSISMNGVKAVKVFVYHEQCINWHSTTPILQWYTWQESFAHDTRCRLFRESSTAMG